MDCKFFQDPPIPSDIFQSPTPPSPTFTSPTTSANKKRMLIPNPHNEKLTFSNEVLYELLNSVYDYQLPQDSNSKSGYAINIRKFQEYPSKPRVSNVKCAQNTKEY